MEALAELIGKLPWFAWVAIVAILGGTATSIVTARMRHTERMAMIDAGLDPDSGRDKGD